MRIHISPHTCLCLPAREADVREGFSFLADEVDAGADIVLITSRQIKLQWYSCLHPCSGETVISGEGPAFERLVKVARDAFTFMCGPDTREQLATLEKRQPTGESLPLLKWDLCIEAGYGGHHSEIQRAGSFAVLYNISPDHFSLVLRDHDMKRAQRRYLVRKLIASLLNPDGSRC